MSLSPSLASVLIECSATYSARGRDESSPLTLFPALLRAMVVTVISLLVMRQSHSHLLGFDAAFERVGDESCEVLASGWLPAP
jgi:hypothetical protein